MSQDLENLLNATAVEPSRPIDPAALAQRVRRRRLRRHTTMAVTGVAAVVALAAVLTVPQGTSGDGNFLTVPTEDAGPSDDGSPAADSLAPSPRKADILQPGEECPVTIPPTPGFVPPDRYPAEPSGAPEKVWYGTAELWTVLRADDGSPPGKSVWWSTSFDISVEQQPAIHVVWERLDADTEPIMSGWTTNGHTPEDGWFMMADITMSTGPGCWQVTATYKGAELSFVYERQ